MREPGTAPGAFYAVDPSADVLSAAWRAPEDRPAGDRGEPVGHRVAAPLDVVDRRAGVRLRHLPGAVDLVRRRATPQEAATAQHLRSEIEACLAAAPRRITILKAVPCAGVGEGAPCPECGEPMVASMLDCALGEQAELVVERVAGRWCWSCLAGSIDDGKELSRRLERWRPGTVSHAVPSFAYDTAAHPRAIQLEVTTRCNLACGYCSNRLIAEPRDADFDHLLGLMDRIDLSVVDHVELTGLGETLLHPRLLDIVREIRKRGAPAEIGMVTNGVSLTRSRIAPLIEAGLTRVCVSVDTLDAERFSRLRPGSRLEKILGNIEELARFRDESGLEPFRLRLHGVMTDDPFGEAEPLIEYSLRHGLELPVLTPLDLRAVSLGLYDRDQLEIGRTTAATFEAFYTWVVRRWLELGGRVDVPARMKSLHERPLTPARRSEGFHHSGLEEYPSLRLCPWAIDKCYIAGDGSLLSCCNAMTDIPRRALADLSDRALRDVWGDELLWAYRLPLALDRLPAGCVGCDQAPPQGLPLQPC